jgi:predicted amidohydrolase YtcJ
VVLVHTSYHRAIANSRALAALGFGPAVPGGVVHLDADGAPTGMLTEAATGRPQARTTAALLERYAAAGTDPVDLVAAHARRYLAQGVTALHDALLLPAFYRLLVRAAVAGRLPLYVTPLRADPEWLDPVAVWLGRGGRGAGGADADLDPDAPRPPRLRRGGVKFLAHGIYEGMVFYTQAELDDLVARVVRRDLTVAIHATYSPGTDLALGAAAHARRAVPRSASRVRIEHFFRGYDADFARAKALGVGVVTQPAAVWQMGDLWLSGRVRPGAHRFPVGQLLAAGVPVAGSSDAPCFPLPPLRSIAAAVDRRTSTGALLEVDQAITVEAALRLHTLGAAWAGGTEDEEGSLTPGKLANFVVLSGDPRATPPEGIPDLSVDETWVDGALAYRRDGAPAGPFELVPHSPTAQPSNRLALASATPTSRTPSATTRTGSDVCLTGAEGNDDADDADPGRRAR